MLAIREFLIKAGVSDSRGIEGNYIALVSSDYQEAVICETERGDVFELYVGDEVYIGAFTRITLKTLSSLDVRVKIAFSTSGERYKSGRVGGTVKMVNGEIERVRKGNCFAGYTALASGAAQTPVIQLWNPVGSGVFAVVNKVIVTAQNPEHVLLGVQNAQLVTLAPAPQNKNIAKGQNGKCQIRSDNYIAISGMGKFHERYLKAFDTAEFNFSEPLVLDEGRGLIVFCATLAANTLWGQFQYSEELMVNS